MSFEPIVNRLGIYGESHAWIKAQEYELIQNSDGLDYIVPVGDVFEEYNPFDVEKELIHAFTDILVNVPREYENFDDASYYYNLSDKEKKKIGKSVLKFVKKFGLLGLINFLPSSSEADEKKGMYYKLPLEHLPDLLEFVPQFSFYRGLNTKDNRLTSTEKNYLMYSFVGTFFPESLYRKQVMKIAEILYKNQSGEGISRQSVFRKAYSEPVYLILNTAHKLFAFIKSITKLKNDPNRIKDVFEDLLKLRSSDVSLGLTFDQKIRLRWKFNSLVDAMIIILCMNAITEKQNVKTCEKCRRVFMTPTAIAKYCSTSCGNAARVQRHRKKKEK